VIGRRPKLDLTLLAPKGGSAAAAREGARRVWIEGGWAEAEVLRRLDLQVGAKVIGPALLEQPDATVFVDPGLQADVDSFGNLLIRDRARLVEEAIRVMKTPVAQSDGEAFRMPSRDEVHER
jgi:N-methylhydantoinase A